MAFRQIFGLIVSLAVIVPGWAQEIEVNPSHPDQYTVVKGDTLWEISGRFLRKPHQWPLIWEGNPQIDNPHLIYPGDTIYFSEAGGKPRLSLSPSGFLGNSGSSREVKLYPRIREMDLIDAIELIPSEKIAKYLASPRVVGQDDLENSPYVIDFAGEHLVAGPGDRVYVRAIEKPESLTYTIYRKGDTFVSAETKEVLGYEAKFVANTTLQEPGDPATLLVTRSTSEIRMGDRLMPHQEGDFTLHYFPKSPESEIQGSIISVLDGVTQIGRYNVVAIDKGASDGLKVGHVLDIYKKGKSVRDPFSKIRNDTIQLPNELAGTLMIFRTFDRISYALVMDARQAIHVLDKVQTP
ncbi:LysM peptidoglycan-binding domain-containing protein [Methylotuvimicrobium sp. KM2]|uniref:LysM peptidoglycan-binding domain-containing protein n=1 Tax=Methylotuvimicrobium sp. KM2 TaxID=3133976 RepID=UPI0031012AE3